MVSIIGKTNSQEEIFKNLLINNIPQELNQVDIQIYKDEKLRKELIGCSVLDFVGGQTTGNRKADIKIKHSIGSFLLSLKNTPFGAWQSVDSLTGDEIDRIIIEIISAGKRTYQSTFLQEDFNFGIRYDSGNKIYRIVDKTNNDKQLIVDLNKNSKEKVVFGSDILNNGAVIQINQKDNNIVYYSNNKLIINVMEYIDSKSQLDDLKIVYRISNIKGSRSSKRYPGIRIQAVPYSEIAKDFIKGKYKGADIII
jgi:hypothetical protein